MEKEIERLMNIDFENETTHGDGDDKYIETKMRPYKDNINTNFYDEIGCKKVAKEKIPHECLSIIIIDSILYVYIYIFFLSGFSFTNIHDSQDSRERGRVSI